MIKMKYFSSYYATGLVVIATIAVGIVHGNMTLRWGPGSDLQTAAAMLQSFPASFGDWQMKSSYEMSTDTIKMLRCVGYVDRSYVNQKTGENVTLSIVLGPPGAISEHTPEVCFSSQNFGQIVSRKSVRIERKRHSGEDIVGDEYWFVDFEKNRNESRKK